MELKKQWIQYQTQREFHADVTKDVTALIEFSLIINKNGIPKITSRKSMAS